MIMKKIIAHFDISPEGKNCYGTLTLDGNFIIKSLDGAEEKFNISDISEAVQYTDIGCGRLELKPKNSKDDGSENIHICRFSMSYVGEVGEFVKVLNHLFETGETLDINTDDLPVCPKCHRHYLRGMNMCMFCVKKSYVFSRAFGFFKPYVKAVIGAGLLLTVANVISAIMPLFNSILIDDYLLPTADATPFFQSRTTGIVAIALIMAVSFAISQIFNILSSRISNKVGSRFSGDLRNIVYGKIQELSLTSMSKRSAGNLIHRVTHDTERVKEFFNQQGRYLIQQVIMFTVILTILFKTNWLLTLIVLIPVPIGAFMMTRFRHATRVRYFKQWRINSKATSIQIGRAHV